MRLSGPLVFLVLLAPACSSSSDGGASDGGPDVSLGDATYVPPAPCTCPAGQELILFGPPGWCPGSAPMGGTASCGTASCYTPCRDGGATDAAASDAGADVVLDASEAGDAGDAGAEPDATGDGAAD